MCSMLQHFQVATWMTKLTDRNVAVQHEEACTVCVRISERMVVLSYVLQTLFMCSFPVLARVRFSEGAPSPRYLAVPFATWCVTCFALSVSASH